MNTSSLASSRLRSTLGAALFALLLGGCAVLLSDDTETAAVAPVSAAASALGDAAPASAAPGSSAPSPAGGTVAAVESAATAPVDGAPAGDPPVDDPLGDVIVEPVDPAEALFGDHAAVAVSN